MSDNTPKTSSYEKSVYTGVIRVRDQSTGQMTDKPITRTIYKYMGLNPDLVIPAGTKIGKETIKKDTTNLERMKAGQAPVIMVEDSKGSSFYDRLELHHLTGEERNRASQFFSSEIKEGAIVEIPQSKHQKYNHVLHGSIGPNNSFRKIKVSVKSEDGTIKRQRVKSYDAKQYDAFRPQYWKDRAAEFEMARMKSSNDTSEFSDSIAKVQTDDMSNLNENEVLAQNGSTEEQTDDMSNLNEDEVLAQNGSTEEPTNDMGDLNEDEVLAQNGSTEEQTDDMSNLNEDEVLAQNDSTEEQTDDMGNLNEDEVLAQNDNTEEQTDDMNNLNEDEVLAQNGSTEEQTDDMSNPNEEEVLAQNGNEEDHQEEQNIEW